MRITAPLAIALALAWAVPAAALNLTAGTLRGSDDATPAPQEPVFDPWQEIVALDEATTEAADADDQLDVMLDEDSIVLGPVAETDEIAAPTTVQEAMMALAPIAPATETIPVLHAAPSAPSVSYHVPRSSSSLSVLGGSWQLNNPRGSTTTLGAEWAR